MSSNLPEDWGGYGRTCGKCGVYYHASGTDVCACIQCDKCYELIAPDDYKFERKDWAGHDITVCLSCDQRLTEEETDEALD